MNKDSFLEGIRKQYADEINEAYLECAHNGRIDAIRLKATIYKLGKAAKLDGLSARDFEDLVKSVMPETHADKAA